MKTIMKLLTLLIISLLIIPVMGSADSTIPDNTTVDNYTSTDPIPEETLQIYCAPDGKNYLQFLPDKSVLIDLATVSNAQGNSTFENELVTYDDRIPFDTYVVHTNDGSGYTVVVPYDNEKRNGKDFWKVQFYFNQYHGAIVNPTPMVICKPLTIKSIDGSWNIKTAVIIDYKIVYSHYGQEIEDEEYVPPTGEIEYEQPEEIIPEVIEDEPPQRVPPVDDTNINVTTDNTISNTSGDQNNNTVIIENVTASGNVTGDNNIVKYFTVILSNVKDNIINLNVF